MKINTTEVHPLKLYSIKDISNLTGIPVSSLYKKMSDGDIPPGVKIGKHRRWRYQDLNEWLETAA